MNKNTKRLRVYSLLMLIIAAAAVALRSTALILHFDHASGLHSDTTLINISNIIIWAGAIFMLTYMFIADKLEVEGSFSTPATYVPSGLVGAAVLFLGARTLSHLLNTGRYPFLSKEVLTDSSTYLTLAAVLLAFLSVVHFFLNSYEQRARADIRALFSIATVLFLIIYSILVYTDDALTVNDPRKIYDLMAFIFSSVFFLYETRISLGREMWRAYSAFGLIAALFCAYSAIPTFITYYINGPEIFFGASESAVASIEECTFKLALFIYITARLLLLSSIKEKRPSKLIEVMGEHAAINAQRHEESQRRHEEVFASKQLSFFELLGEKDSSEEETPEGSAAAEEDITSEEASTISDDAIYEAIFGHMPAKETDEAEKEETPPEDDTFDAVEKTDKMLRMLDEAEELERIKNEEKRKAEDESETL